MTSFERVESIAEAVLYEGYLLFPYTASATKNQLRWQFGVLVPERYARQETGESSSMQAELIGRVDSPHPEIAVRLRFLRMQERIVEAADGAEFIRVPSLTTDTESYISFEEAVPVDIGFVMPARSTVELPAQTTIEEIRERGNVRGRIVRTMQPLLATVELTEDNIDERYVRVRLRIENRSDFNAGEDRKAALQTAMLSTHALFGGEGIRWCSHLDPPDDAAAHVAACTNTGVFPVLAGDGADAHTSDLALASPIILYDFPHVADQSRGGMFDGTEIDELLNLSVLALSDAERSEARATDAASRAIVDRAESLDANDFDALHGIMQAEEPRPGSERVTIEGMEVAAGARVRLHPKRRADVWDYFIDGKTARVAGVYRDMEDNVHVAVIVEDDPASEFHEWYGRSLFFGCDEVEPLEVAK